MAEGSFHESVKVQRERLGLLTLHRPSVSPAYIWIPSDKGGTSLSLYFGPIKPHTAGAALRNWHCFRKKLVGMDEVWRSARSKNSFQRCVTCNTGKFCVRSSNLAWPKNVTQILLPSRSPEQSG